MPNVTHPTQQNGVPSFQSTPSTQSIAPHLNRTYSGQANMSPRRPLMSCLRKTGTPKPYRHKAHHKVKISEHSTMYLFNKIDNNKNPHFNKDDINKNVCLEIIKLNACCKKYGISRESYDNNRVFQNEFIFGKTKIMARGLEKYLFNNTKQYNNKIKTARKATLDAVENNPGQTLPRESLPFYHNQLEQRAAYCRGHFDDLADKISQH